MRRRGCGERAGIAGCATIEKEENRIQAVSGVAEEGEGGKGEHKKGTQNMRRYRILGIGRRIESRLLVRLRTCTKNRRRTSQVSSCEEGKRGRPKGARENDILSVPSTISATQTSSSALSAVFDDSASLLGRSGRNEKKSHADGQMRRATKASETENGRSDAAEAKGLHRNDDAALTEGGEEGGRREVNAKRRKKGGRDAGKGKGRGRI